MARVYVLLRPKRNEDISTRLKKMLHESSVMHLLRGNPVLEKVVPVAGNMLATDLGISLEDRRKLQQEVDTVIHCAADIRLEAGIKDLLQANYEGTRQLLKLCCSFNNLASFVHVSSAYVNMNAPKGSLVKEAIYPLHYGDQLVDDYELVQVRAGFDVAFVAIILMHEELLHCKSQMRTLVLSLLYRCVGAMAGSLLSSCSDPCKLAIKIVGVSVNTYICMMPKWLT